jgi:hypothetical protein
MKLHQVYVSAILILSMTQIAVAMPLSEAAQEPLTLSGLLQPVDSHEDQDKKRMGLQTIHFNFYSSVSVGGGSSDIDAIQLCTATDETCTVCNTNVSLLTTGTKPSYAHTLPGTTYQVSQTALATYFATHSLAAGTYNVGMFVKSSGTACNGDTEPCSASREGGGHELCMQATYSGGSVTALTATGSGDTNLDTATTAVTPFTSLSASVNTLGAKISGNSRTITITNVGSETASSVVYSPAPALPSGTTITPANCGDMAAAATCVLTVNPGATASALAYDRDSSPIGVVVNGSNTLKNLNVDLSIVTDASVYQKGYIFSIDDTTATTGSIGGRAAQFDRQGLNPTVWGSDGISGGTGDDSLDQLPGIDQTSTTSTGSPSFSTFETWFNDTGYNGTAVDPTILTFSDFSQCTGKEDGLCDSNNILKFYNTYITNVPELGVTNLIFYAAGICNRYAIDESATACTTETTCYNDWYLPALCELGTDDGIGACSTGSGTDDIADKLSGLITGADIAVCPQGGGGGSDKGCLETNAWSATQYSVDFTFVGNQTYSTDTGTGQGIKSKADLGNVVCIRKLTE